MIYDIISMNGYGFYVWSAFIFTSQPKDSDCVISLALATSIGAVMSLVFFSIAIIN